jgi:hypothetical protein
MRRVEKIPVSLWQGAESVSGEKWARDQYVIHEKSKDLQNVGHKGVLASSVLEPERHDLSCEGRRGISFRCRGSKMGEEDLPMMAPNFPDAAESPWAVLR